MKVIEIVKDYLIRHGYDGLYLSDAGYTCACLLNNLAPCGEINGDCRAGYRRDGCGDDCGMGCEFHVVGKGAR